MRNAGESRTKEGRDDLKAGISVLEKFCQADGLSKSLLTQIRCHASSFQDLPGCERTSLIPRVCGKGSGQRKVVIAVQAKHLVWAHFWIDWKESDEKGQARAGRARRNFLRATRK